MTCNVKKDRRGPIRAEDIELCACKHEINVAL